jgi:hypothetical protein
MTALFEFFSMGNSMVLLLFLCDLRELCGEICNLTLAVTVGHGAKTGGVPKKQ